MDSSTDSGIACFIVAIIEAVIFILLIVVEGRSTESNVSRENYVPFDSERERPRESTFKGIAMMNLPQQRPNRQEDDLL